MLPTSWWGHRQQQLQSQNMAHQRGGPASDKGVALRRSTELVAPSPRSSLPGKLEASAPDIASPLQRRLHGFSSTVDEEHATTAFNIIDDKPAGTGQSPPGSRAPPSRGPSNVSNPYSPRHATSEASDLFNVVLSSGPTTARHLQLRNQTVHEDPMAVATSSRSALNISPPARSTTRLASNGGGSTAEVTQHPTSWRISQAFAAGGPVGPTVPPQAPVGSSVMIQKLSLLKGMSERLPSIIMKKPPTLSRVCTSKV
jgi:hypothetical protein